MVKLLQSEYRPYFLFGAGSNEHGQLLLPGLASSGGAVGNPKGEGEMEKEVNGSWQQRRRQQNKQDGLDGNAATASLSSLYMVGRWHPVDGSKMVRVACGRRHTVALDENGWVWTLGDKKYSQLG